MLKDSIDIFKSFFIFPGVSTNLIVIGVLLGIAFGAIWLCAHWPPLFKQPRLWAVLAGSALVTVLALSFIQVPLQTWLQQGMVNIMSGDTFNNFLLLTGIPIVLLSGLVQEGAKMVPVALWWWDSGKNITPKLGLAVGAIAGAGYGILEAVAVHNQMFAAGWTIQAFQIDGFLAIAGFWERFFAIGFHIAASAIVGYGLAKGKGWQFYLIAAGLHAVLNYSSLLLSKGYFTIVQAEVYVAVVAVAAVVYALLLRWGPEDGKENEIPGTAGPTGTEPKTEA